MSWELRLATWTDHEILARTSAFEETCEGPLMAAVSTGQRNTLLLTGKNLTRKPFLRIGQLGGNLEEDRLAEIAPGFMHCRNRWLLQLRSVASTH